MKLPLLVFSLIVVYWTCVSCAKEDINSTRDLISSDEDYISGYEDVPWERSLSRNKRSIIIQPVIDLLLKGMGKSIGLMFKSALKMFKPTLGLLNFGYDVLIGKDMCPKVEKLSLGLILQITLNPITTIRTILCNVFDLIGSTGRAMLLKGIQYGITFTKKVIIPGTHTILNKAKDTGKLPPSINAMIDMFNVTYKMMKLVGYL